MASYLPTFAPFRAPPKRKMSGPAISLTEQTALSLSPTFGGRSPRHWFDTVDLREVVGFVFFMLATIVDVAAGVMVWVLFFKFVVEPEERHTRATWGGVWVLYTVAWWYFRHLTRSRIDANMRSTQDHVEIFVSMSLVMVFAVNVAFYMHVPAVEPLKDLGFLLIPEQAADSKWRPLSDILTAGVPVLFVLQTAFMTRENRCRVISTFFRCATVCYFLRMLSIAVTSLPGPAPHCRLGSPDYHPPKTWIDIVTRVGPIYGQYNSCGDLIFSGHMAYTTSAVLLYLRVLDRNFAHYSKLRWTLGAWYLVVLGVLCIAGRKHYTVDVVLGFVIATLVYFHFEHSWVPLCFQLPGGQLPLNELQRYGLQGDLQHWYPAKRFSMDVTDEAADEFDDEAQGEGNKLLGKAGSGSSGTKSGGKGGALDQVQLIC